MLYFGSFQPFEHLLETSFEIFCAMVFVIHSYLFKPDHGHHHFSYLSCFSETIKPQHSQKQARVLCDWSSERTHVCVSVDFCICAVLTWCQTHAWWAGWAAIGWRRLLALLSPGIQRFQSDQMYFTQEEIVMNLHYPPVSQTRFKTSPRLKCKSEPF